MQQRPESTRIASDLREVRDRWRGWVLGFVGAAGERDALGPTGGGWRVALAAATTPSPRPVWTTFGSTSDVAECTCLDDCPIDHENA